MPSVPMDRQLEDDLTTLLRHKAKRRGIIVRNDGLMKLDDVVFALKATRDSVEHIIQSSEKRGVSRFEMTIYQGIAWVRATSKVSFDNMNRLLLSQPIDECLRDRPPYFQPPPPVGPPPPMQAQLAPNSVAEMNPFIEAGPTPPMQPQLLAPNSVAESNPFIEAGPTPPMQPQLSAPNSVAESNPIIGAARAGDVTARMVNAPPSHGDEGLEGLARMYLERIKTEATEKKKKAIKDARDKEQEDREYSNGLDRDVIRDEVKTAIENANKEEQETIARAEGVYSKASSEVSFFREQLAAKDAEIQQLRKTVEEMQIETAQIPTLKLAIENLQAKVDSLQPARSIDVDHGRDTSSSIPWKAAAKAPTPACKASLPTPAKAPHYKAPPACLPVERRQTEEMARKAANDAAVRKAVEEDEVEIYFQLSKLYRFVTNEWEERGMGVAKLCKNNKTGQVRFFMQQEKTMKVLSNHLVVDVPPYCKLFPSADGETCWVWTAQDFACDEMKVERLALKFATSEKANHFKQVFENSKQSTTKVTSIAQEPVDEAQSEEEAKSAEAPAPAEARKEDTPAAQASLLEEAKAASEAPAAETRTEVKPADEAQPKDETEPAEAPKEVKPGAQAPPEEDAKKAEAPAPEETLKEDELVAEVPATEEAKATDEAPAADAPKEVKPVEAPAPEDAPNEDKLVAEAPAAEEAKAAAEAPAAEVLNEVRPADEGRPKEEIEPAEAPLEEEPTKGGSADEADGLLEKEDGPATNADSKLEAHLLSTQVPTELRAADAPREEMAAADSESTEDSRPAAATEKATELSNDGEIACAESAETVGSLRGIDGDVNEADGSLEKEDGPAINADSRLDAHLHSTQAPTELRAADASREEMVAADAESTEDSRPAAAMEKATELSNDGEIACAESAEDSMPAVASSRGIDGDVNEVAESVEVRRSPDMRDDFAALPSNDGWHEDAEHEDSRGASAGHEAIASGEAVLSIPSSMGRGWRTYQCPDPYDSQKTSCWWWADDHHWFLEANPAPWEQFQDLSGRTFWWNGETEEWFYATLCD